MVIQSLFFLEYMLFQEYTVKNESLLKKFFLFIEITLKRSPAPSQSFEVIIVDDCSFLDNSMKIKQIA